MLVIWKEVTIERERRFFSLAGSTRYQTESRLGQSQVAWLRRGIRFRCDAIEHFFFVSRPPKWKKKSETAMSERRKEWIRGSESSNSMIKLNPCDGKVWLKRLHFHNRDTLNKDGLRGPLQSRRFLNFFFGFHMFFSSLPFQAMSCQAIWNRNFQVDFSPSISALISWNWRAIPAPGGWLQC